MIQNAIIELLNDKETDHEINSSYFGNSVKEQMKIDQIRKIIVKQSTSCKNNNTKSNKGSFIDEFNFNSAYVTPNTQTKQSNIQVLNGDNESDISWDD